MRLRTPASLAGVLGGFLLVGRWLLHAIGTPLEGGVELAAQVLGLLLVAVPVAAAGAGLVTGLAWLRWLVAVAVPLLAWSLLVTAYQAVEPVVADGVVGAVVLVGSLGVLLLAPSPPGKHR